MTSLISLFKELLENHSEITIFFKSVLFRLKSGSKLDQKLFFGHVSIKQKDVHQENTFL